MGRTRILILPALRLCLFAHAVRLQTRNILEPAPPEIPGVGDIRRVPDRLGLNQWPAIHVQGYAFRNIIRGKPVLLHRHAGAVQLLSGIFHIAGCYLCRQLWRKPPEYPACGIRLLHGIPPGYPASDIRLHGLPAGLSVTGLSLPTENQHRF